MKGNLRWMLLGIFLMVLAVWCLVFGAVDDFFPASLAGVLLPVAAISVFLAGWPGGKDQDPKE